MITLLSSVFFMSGMATVFAFLLTASAPLAFAFGGIVGCCCTTTVVITILITNPPTKR